MAVFRMSPTAVVTTPMAAMTLPDRRVFTEHGRACICIPRSLTRFHLEGKKAVVEGAASVIDRNVGAGLVERAALRSSNGRGSRLLSPRRPVWISATRSIARVARV